MVPEDRGVHDHHSGEHATVRQAWDGSSSWELISYPQTGNRARWGEGKGRANTNWKWHEPLKSQSPPLVTHFLQQSHTVPPNPYWTVLLTRNQAFRHMSLWGPLSLKPLSSPVLKAGVHWWCFSLYNLIGILTCLSWFLPSSPLRSHQCLFSITVSAPNLIASI